MTHSCCCCSRPRVTSGALWPHNARPGSSTCSRFAPAAKQLKVEAPSVAIANKTEEETIREIRARNGVLSRKTWAAQANLDYEVEQANRLQEPPMPGESPIAPQLPTETNVDTRLNGAQITAAVEVLNGVVAGTTAELVAVELLIAVGIDDATARRMVTATKTSAKPAPDPKQVAVAAALESVRCTDEAKALLGNLYP